MENTEASVQAKSTITSMEEGIQQMRHYHSFETIDENNKKEVKRIKESYTICAVIIDKNILIGCSRYRQSEIRNWSKKLANEISKGRALKTPILTVAITEDQENPYRLLKRTINENFPDFTMCKKIVDKWFIDKEPRKKLQTRDASNLRLLQKTKSSFKRLAGALGKDKVLTFLTKEESPVTKD